jgi:hemoglobin
MKKDILNKKDIEKLVNLFYDKVKKDNTIGHFFSGNFNMEKHLEIMYKFWENIVFFTGSYEGNPMDKHLELHAKTPLSKKDFQKWKKLFNESVDELYFGEKADLIKLKASNIAAVMQTQILKD